MSELDIRVLHVDDRRDFAELTTDMLERENDRITVEIATSANEGLTRLDNGDFDCIISDYDMPKQNGIEFLESVRENYPNLPFILYTGKGSEEVASRAFSAGATDYLQKTNGTDQYTLLANKVANSFEKYEAEQTMAQRARAMETANEGIALVDENGQYTEVNAAYAELYGTDPDVLIGNHWTVTVPDEEVERLHQRDAFNKLNEQGSWTGKAQGQRADGSTYAKHLSLALLKNGGHVCVVRDITENTIREDGIEALHSTASEFMQASTPEEVADITATALCDVLGLPTNGIHLYDEQREGLVPVAWTETTEGMIGEPPTFEPGDSIAWRAFETGEAQIYDNISSDSDRYNPDTDIRSEIVLPLEAHGVLLIGSTDPNAFTETDIDLVRTLATHATTALNRIESEQSLRKERLFIDQALDALTDLFYVIEPDGEPRRWNSRVPEVTGYTDEHIGDMQLIDLFPKDEQTRITEAVTETLATGQATTEADLLTADGERIPYEFTGSRLTDSDDNVTNIVGVGRDISERKARKQELETLRDRTEFVLEATETHIWVIDLATGEIEFHGPVEPLFGETPENVAHIEQFFERVPHPEDRSRLEQLYTEVKNKEKTERFSSEFRINTADEACRWMQIEGETQTSGGSRRLIGLTTDITEQKRDEQNLERQKERFEKFASVVSHDLRNPLNVASGRLELAQRECDCTHLDDVARAHSRMEALITDVLTLAREGEQFNETEVVDLADVSAGCWRNVRTTNATLITDTEQSIRAAPSRLKQLLENLMRNAVEHAGEDVTIAIGDLDSGFYVADDGSGIPAEEREQVFKAGYSTTNGGTGFGLNIVQEIAKAHDWTITITESETEGTRFEITNVTVVSQ